MLAEEDRYKLTRKTDVPWHLPLPELSEDQRRVLRDYVGLQDHEIRPYLEHFRGRIWHIHPYPCIGMWGFLKPTLKWSEINGEYNQVVRRIKHGDKFLDVGCAMGQDLRWLAADGVPTENLFAADITDKFWESSFDLFRDASTLHSHFIRCDIFDDDSTLVHQLHGETDIIAVGDFLHLFSWDDCINAVCRLVQLSRPCAGTMIIGKNMGNKLGRYVPSGFGRGGWSFVHNERTFREMWVEVERRTGTRWDVDVRMADVGEDPWWSPAEEWAFMAEGVSGMRFVCTRRESTFKAKL